LNLKQILVLAAAFAVALPARADEPLLPTVEGLSIGRFIASDVKVGEKLLPEASEEALRVTADQGLGLYERLSRTLYVEAPDVFKMPELVSGLVAYEALVARKLLKPSEPGARLAASAGYVALLSMAQTQWLPGYFALAKKAFESASERDRKLLEAMDESMPQIPALATDRLVALGVLGQKMPAEPTQLRLRAHHARLLERGEAEGDALRELARITKDPLDLLDAAIAKTRESGAELLRKAMAEVVILHPEVRPTAAAAIDQFERLPTSRPSAELPEGMPLPKVRSLLASLHPAVPRKVKRALVSQAYDRHPKDPDVRAMRVILGTTAGDPVAVSELAAIGDEIESCDVRMRRVSHVLPLYYRDLMSAAASAQAGERADMERKVLAEDVLCLKKRAPLVGDVLGWVTRKGELGGDEGGNMVARLERAIEAIGKVHPGSHWVPIARAAVSGMAGKSAKSVVPSAALVGALEAARKSAAAIKDGRLRAVVEADIESILAFAALHGSAAQRGDARKRLDAIVTREIDHGRLRDADRTLKVPLCPREGCAPSSVGGALASLHTAELVAGGADTATQVMEKLQKALGDASSGLGEARELKTVLLAVRCASLWEQRAEERANRCVEALDEAAPNDPATLLLHIAVDVDDGLVDESADRLQTALAELRPAHTTARHAFIKWLHFLAEQKGDKERAKVWAAEMKKLPAVRFGGHIEPILSLNGSVTFPALSDGQVGAELELRVDLRAMWLVLPATRPQKADSDRAGGDKTPAKKGK